jgi:hypothetical protein
MNILDKVYVVCPKKYLTGNTLHIINTKDMMDIEYCVKEVTITSVKDEVEKGLD